VEKIRLGRTNMTVSRLGFGGIPIQRISEDEALDIVRRCLELGITFFDTANAYTSSEERIGKAISGRGEGLVLATKTLDRTRQGIENHIELSRKRLGVDSIDLYQFHNVSDRDTLNKILEPDGPLPVVEKARSAGLVRHIGITSHQIDIAIEAVKTDRFETIMFPLNFLYYEAVNELLPLVRERDVGFIIMKPMAGGVLDGATLAFKYLFQFPDLALIVGIEKLAEIEEISRIWDEPWELTAAEQREIERLRQELGTRFCRHCDYCQPCPVGIPIADVMSYPSLLKRLPQVRLFSGGFAEAFTKAADCTECGDCEERCPYQLSIRDMIVEYRDLYRVEKKKYLEQVASG
jgi:predicted aldo/keto reductase-like oxidoreductase